MICTYQDYAEEVEVETSSLAEKLDQEVNEQIVFPVKLHQMLDEAERQGITHIVGWAPHGRCFLVRDKQAFVKRVLASWFRQSKFASFQRQLNLYGFKRITTGADKGGYYHELFLRAKVFLCNRIERVKIKGSKPGRIKAYADAEPDFYRMKAMPNEAGSEPQDKARNGSTMRAQSPQAAKPTTTNARASSYVQPADMTAALNDASRRLSFLVKQPLAAARKVSGASEENKQGTVHVQDPKHLFFPERQMQAQATSTNNTSLLQTSLKQAEDQQDLLLGNSAAAFSLLPNNSLASSVANFNASVDLNAAAQAIAANFNPSMLQASNLVNLNDTNAGIFGNMFGGSDAAATAALPSLWASINNGLSVPQGVQQQQPESQPQALQAALALAGPLQATLAAPLQVFGEPQMPTVSIPNENSLSESLPTAESLAMEDLFDFGGLFDSESAMGAVLGTPAFEPTPIQDLTNHTNYFNGQLIGAAPTSKLPQKQEDKAGTHPLLTDFSDIIEEIPMENLTDHLNDHDLMPVAAPRTATVAPPREKQKDAELSSAGGDDDDDFVEPVPVQEVATHVMNFNQLLMGSAGVTSSAQKSRGGKKKKEKGARLGARQGFRSLGAVV